jgi:hypothetical protein
MKIATEPGRAVEYGKGRLLVSDGRPAAGTGRLLLKGRKN